ncbi:MAG: hypothetical protein ACQEQ2_01635 [Pseudomonadota bacterium]
MSTFQLHINSATELAERIIPEFSLLTLMIETGTLLPEDPVVGEDVSLILIYPELSAKPVNLRANIALCLEAKQAKGWIAVTLSPEQQALTHHINYLCRHHRSDYGKLFEQLITEFCHSH